MCCCKCCTCCCSGSGRSGHKRMKSEPTPMYPVYPVAAAPNPYAQAHAAAPPAPIDNRPVHQQYRSHATPAFSPAPAPEPPQFATFDSQKKPVNEDALPAMPSWKDARDVHVEVEEPAVPEKRGDVEMDRLDRSGSATGGSMTGAAAIGGARRSPGPGRSPMQRSPTGDSYGYDQGFEKESLVGGMQRSPHTSPVPQGRPYAQQDDYRRGSPAQNLSPVYGAGDGYGRRSPASPQAYNNSQYDQRDPYNDHQGSYTQMPHTDRYDSPAPPSYHTNNNYATNNNAPYDNFAPSPVQPRVHTPNYEASEPLVQPSPQPASAYPGQQSYTPQSSYPGQQSYQAFNPGQTGQQYSGVQRKAVDGSYRDL